MKKLLFIGCNHAQLPYLLELKKYNFEIIGTDKNPSAPGKDLCNNFYQVAYDDYDGLIEIGYKENFNEEDFIFTASSQFAHKGAAHFANQFGIEFPMEKIIDVCLDKTLFYNQFQKFDIPIPETSFVKNKNELINSVKKLDQNKGYYLKSDFSKNPNYVYRFKPDTLNVDNIFWGKDRYLQNHYILQKEFVGEPLRVNIYGNRFNVFKFEGIYKLSSCKDEIEKRGILNSLIRFIENMCLSKWLIKFDIIMNEENYAVLDVGLEPPYRMVNESKAQGINFAKYYVKQYISKKISYPKSLD